MGPSSKTEGTLASGEKELKQLPGGPVEEYYLMFVKLLQQHQKVGLNPESIAAQPIKRPNTNGILTVRAFSNGTRVEGTMFTDGVPDPKVMAEMTPLIKVGRCRKTLGFLRVCLMKIKQLRTQRQAAICNRETC